MKRGGPLRRKQPLQGGTPLERGKPLRRGGPLRRTGLQPKQAVPPGYDSLRSLGWQRATVAAGVCACCGARPTPHDPLQAHHVTTREALRKYVSGLRLKRGEARSLLDELLWDKRNGMALLRSCHDLHTRGKKRVPQQCLTAAHREFAAAVGLEYALDRHYAPEVP